SSRALLTRLQRTRGRGAGAAIVEGIALPARRHQAGAGQHLEVVAHAGLFHVENAAQLQHAVGTPGQYPQNRQAQRVPGGLEAAGEAVQRWRCGFAFWLGLRQGVEHGWGELSEIRASVAAAQSYIKII